MTLSETDGENFTAVIKHVWKCPKMTSSSLQVFNEQYFLVTMDDLCGIEESEGAGRSYLCHRDSPGIFPAQWSLKNGLPLSPPPGLLCQMLYFISCGWYQNIINNKLDHLCFFPSIPGFICFSLSVRSVFILSCTGYQGPDFDWADYLKQCEAEAAPQHCFPTVRLPQFSKFTLVRFHFKGLSCVKIHH